MSLERCGWRLFADLPFDHRDSNAMMSTVMQKLSNLILGRPLVWLPSIITLAALSCIEVRDPGVEGPADAGNLVVVGQADPATLFGIAGKVGIVSRRSRRSAPADAERPHP